MEERYLPGRESIYYKLNKVPKKETILFIHGMTGSSSAWAPYEESLKSEYNVISMDLRGHGKSFCPIKYEDYSIKKMSEDIYRVMKREKVQKITLISHSMGTLVALEFLKHRQELVNSAIFVSPAYAPFKLAIAKLVKPLFVLNKFMDGIDKKKSEHLDYSRYLNSGDWNIRRMQADIRNTGIRSCLCFLEQVCSFNGEDVLKKIRAPVLILSGKKDTVFPNSIAINMSKKIKNSKIFTIGNGDHMIVLNQPNLLIKRIKEFMSEYKSKIP